MNFELFLDIFIVFILLMDLLLFPFIKILVVAVIVSADVTVRCSIWFPINSCTWFTHTDTRTCCIRMHRPCRDHGHAYIFLFPFSSSSSLVLRLHSPSYLYSLSCLTAIHLWAWRLCYDSIVLYHWPDSAYQWLTLYAWLHLAHSPPQLRTTYAAHLCTI